MVVFGGAELRPTRKVPLLLEKAHKMLPSPFLFQQLLA
jgi:hypothetical protein